MLDTLLQALTARARIHGLTDAEWARQAGVRKETLSRLRRRHDCDLSTLQALARPLGATLTLGDLPAAATDTDFPANLDREAEAKLLALAASGPDDVARWRAAGPAPFMAGLAVMVASDNGPDRPRWLALADALHPGATRPQAFQAWLDRSPLKPARFLPMLQMERRHG